MEKETVNEIQEAQKDPGRINPRRNTSQLRVIKLIKIKEKEQMLKVTRQK